MSLKKHFKKLSPATWRHYTDQVLRTEHHNALAKQARPTPPPADSGPIPTVELPTPTFLTGSILSEHEVLALRDKLDAESYYLQDRKKGTKIYKEKKRVGIVCETVNLFPSDSESLRRMASEGVPLNTIFSFIAIKLEEHWKSLYPTVPFGFVQFHTNENIIHCHVWHQGTNADHSRITESAGKGRPRGTNVSPGDLATLRCSARGFPVDPEQLKFATAAAAASDASLANPQYVRSASSLVDHLMRSIANAPKNAALKPIFSRSESLYREYRQQRIATSSSGLMDKIEEQNTEIGYLKGRLSDTEKLLNSGRSVTIKIPTKKPDLPGL